MYTIKDNLKTPCQIDVELTTACNHKCRYCYNYWRHDDEKNNFMSKDNLDILIDECVKNKVFNVVLTGGEPFLNFDVLLHGVKRLTDEGILVSCNSNLTVATRDQLQELKRAGLPHILTSLASYDPIVNDKIFNKNGAHEKILKNIRAAVDAGIKISVNTVISKNSKKHIYRTGLVAHALGVSNLFLTRVVPSSSCPEEISNEFVLDNEEYIPALDDAIKVKNETDLNIGSLIQYPVCFLKDVDKYKDFVGRGCSAGKKMVCINSNGESYACFHEFKSYGNVFKDGLKQVWNNMVEWRDGSLIPAECKKCSWYEWCEGGCRVYSDKLNSKDYMCMGSKGLAKPRADYEKSLHLVNDGNFRVRKIKEGLRHRDEGDFWLIHMVGAWITKVSSQNGQFVINKYKDSKTFTINEFPGSKEELAELLTKNIIEKI